MPVPFSKDLREKIVKAYKNGVGTMPEVASIFGVSLKTVSRYVAKYRKDGDLTAGKATGRPAILNKNNLSIIKKIVLSNASGTLYEYCDEFENKVGIKISKSCMWDACNLLDLRRKKKASMHKSKNGKISKKHEKIS